MLHSLNQREHQLKERFGCFFIVMIIIAFGGMAFFRAPNPPKVYSIPHTIEEWSAEIDTLSMLQSAIGYSLTRQQSDNYQAAIIRMKERIIFPLQAQIKADTTKSIKK